jgi:hypothetical protein
LYISKICNNDLVAGTARINFYLISGTMKLDIIAVNRKRANRISRGHCPFDRRGSYMPGPVKGSMGQHMQRFPQHSIYRQDAALDSDMLSECS